MCAQTKIEWTDYTLNWWEGCQKVGPGCDHCYAEARDKRFTGGAHWGPGAPRRKVKGAPAKLRKIMHGAWNFYDQHDRWPRVFCSSLSDVFDNAVPEAWRYEFFDALEGADLCAIQLLTKRVGNVERMIPDSWGRIGWPAHIGLMITVVNQEEADRDIPKLLALKAKYNIPWLGLSMEPLLGAVDICKWLHDSDCDPASWADGCHCQEAGGPFEHTLDWVIVGGESGPNARPMHPDWAQSLRDQCETSGTPFFMKQMGGKRKPFPAIPNDLDVKAFPEAC